MTEFYWQMADPDQPGYFREGHGEAAFLEELRAHLATEEEHTPEDLVASGNLAVYWSSKPLRVVA